MTAQPLSFVPGRRVADDAEPAPARIAPHEVPQSSPDDVVMLPRHLADAAYHLLKAVHALKDNGHQELFTALAKALNKGQDRVIADHAKPCEACHLEVGQGFPHHAACPSEEAARYRAAPVPGLEPAGD